MNNEGTSESPIHEYEFSAEAFSFEEIYSMFYLQKLTLLTVARGGYCCIISVSGIIII
jgi:hypothetical protein